jgi:hypothetical protein
MAHRKPLPKPPPGPRIRCIAKCADGQPCGRWSWKDVLCRNHHPEEAERRRAAGAIRRKRFADAPVIVDGHEYDRASVPTIAGVTDQLLEVDVSMRPLRSDNPVEMARILEARSRVLARAAKTLHVVERDRRPRGDRSTRSQDPSGPSSPDPVPPVDPFGAALAAPWPGGPGSETTQ